MHPTTSPSKAAYGRTYDSKLVTREMHRLGTVPSSSASLPNPSIPQASTSSLSSSSSNDPWGFLHVNLLPLFNGEPLRIPIEDLNNLVRRHISSVVSSTPSKALSTLESDTAELLSSGMVTLNAKLSGIEDDKLISRVVELWGFFWDQVLTYVEGVLLPLQIDPLLSSLYRGPKRPSSPSRQTSGNKQSKPSLSISSSLGMSSYHIDVRTVALCSFRDKIILPLSSRLYARLSATSNMSLNKNSHQEPLQETPPRMQQMLLVLSAQSRPRPQTLSLGIAGGSSNASNLSTGEAAIADLLRVVRSASRLHYQSTFNRPSGGRPIPGSSVSSRQYHPGINNRMGISSGVGIGENSVRAPNFLSEGGPGDRRGRVADKKLTIRGRLNITPALGGDEYLNGGDLDTPRNNTGMDIGMFGFTEIERQRERDFFLDSLKSPDLPPGTPTGSSTTATVTAPRASIGGWGLGAGNEPGEGGDEDEPLDWDQAQAVVERMVGMTSSHQETNGQPALSANSNNSHFPSAGNSVSPAPPVARRRMT
ncbi:HbrB-like-domain-containing protein [Lentinula edodes]|uniref:HbrB-like-domain-containing protein n=1 Tax=Lentinula edodes TaxID=5353 RepID=UPI001E8D313A|nr:HbrB-like-domain-containing protein [Lentinula edodes]KAH7871440.1 HbrB-like-domain-containing protein [Lentinula edodes]